LLLVSGVAHADPQFGLGAYVGVDNLSPFSKLGASWAAERNSEDAAVLGIRLSLINLTDSLRHGGDGLAYGIEAEGGFEPQSTRSTPSFFAPVIGYRAHAIVRYGNRYQIIVLGGIGAETVMSKASFVPTQTVAQPYWGLGFAANISRSDELRIDGRSGYTGDNQGGYIETFEGQISISHTWGAHREWHHSDVSAAYADQHEEKKVGGSTGTVTTSKADKDTDGDGFPDSVDKCPLEPETVNGYMDDDGCPEPDSDGDKIIDALDKCPTQPEDKDGFQDEDGCPDPDNDGDGIPDTADKCPNEPETINGYMDSDGCPDQVPDAIGKAHPSMKFAKGRGKLSADDEAALKPVIDVMVAAADLRITVIAHPDSKSRAASALAQLRADTVRSYMTAHGVTDGARIDAKVGDVAAKGPAIELQVVVGMKAGGGTF
jgi:outer membrane protein OmpA-like peptidoglycan-associated protein